MIYVCFYIEVVGHCKIGINKVDKEWKENDLTKFPLRSLIQLSRDSLVIRQVFQLMWIVLIIISNYSGR